MNVEAAREVLEVYPRKKIDLPTARAIVAAWAEAQGWERDRWGNYHHAEGRRVKITKRVLQRQAKRMGAWRNLSSTPLVKAAQNLVQKAAELLGDEAALQKIRGAKERRAAAAKRQTTRAEEKRERLAIRAMATKIVSAEMPVEFAMGADSGKWPPELLMRRRELEQSLEQLRQRGRMPTDQQLFSTFSPPLAPIVVDVEAEWVEEMRGVPYTITIRHSGKDQAIIEIGTNAGEMGLGTRVDPVTMGISSRMDVGREGDGYLAGRIQRGADGAYGALFLLISQQKQRGTGSRILDLWCQLMEAYGAMAWVAEGIGDEGMAFLRAKIRDGRLREMGGRGKNIVFQCLGGPEGRQQALQFNPADVVAFPERPERVTIGSRTYALSDMGVPISKTVAESFEEAEAEEGPEEGLGGARIIDAGGNPWRYVWVHEPQSDRLEMYRLSDGEWKVLSTPREFPGTFRELKRRGQLNEVGPDDLAEFEAEMRRRSDDTLRALKESWEEMKGDEQQQVDELVEAFYRERVEPTVERGWADIERGVFPFDFDFNERVADHLSRERQARMHVLQQAMKRAGFNHHEDSELERYVLSGLGYSSWEDLDDQQAIQWAWHDFLDDKVYPRVR